MLRRPTETLRRLILSRELSPRSSGTRSSDFVAIPEIVARASSTASKLMIDMSRWIFAFAALAQNPSDVNPVIRTTTQLVQVNVVVHDKNGPVASLTKGDFILTERGQPLAISLFSAESGAGMGRSAEPLPPNTFSNRE